jgi:DNA-binding CsgD family transcriptional regulator
MYMFSQKEQIQDVEKVDAQSQVILIAESLRLLANVAAYQGDDAIACMLYKESLAFIGELDYQCCITSCLERLASIAAAQGRPAHAARLWRIVVSMRDSLAPPLLPVDTLQSYPPAATPRVKSSSRHPAGLTAREAEVLRLVAQGLTDAQVAEKLVISPRTVNWHLTSIYQKIQVSSRCAATRYAIEHHLV